MKNDIMPVGDVRNSNRVLQQLVKQSTKKGK